MITATDSDDPRFVALANQLLESAILASRPSEIYLVRIDQWFDAKWLNFSGKVLGALGVHNNPVTIPPFHPHRVISQDHFSAAPGSDSFVSSPAAPIHIAQSSTQNLKRRIRDVSPSAIFFWVSASTLDLDRGSVMLYCTGQGEVSSWYASFHRAPNWRLDRHRGISSAEIHRQSNVPYHRPQPASPASRRFRE